MIAIDTNVVVRFIADDDAEQSPRARRLVAEHSVWVPLTVILETAWVLRRTYRFAPAQLARALRGFAGISGVTLESPDLVAQALAWFERGMDFADALHLAAAGRCAAFATFDAALARAAADAPSAPPVRAP